MDWKVLAAILVAVAIIISGFIGSGMKLPSIHLPDTGIFVNLKRGIGNILGTNVTGHIPITATFSGGGELKTGDAKFIELKLKTASSFIIGSENMNVSPNSIIKINEFAGQVNINVKDRSLDIDGIAEKIYVSEIGILPHAGKTIAVKGSPEFYYLKIDNTAASGSLKADAGTMKINGKKIILNISNTSINPGNFAGNIEIGDEVNLTGKTDEISVSGEHLIEIK